jgi:hypothetical protein
MVVTLRVDDPRMGLPPQLFSIPVLAVRAITDRCGEFSIVRLDDDTAVSVYNTTEVYEALALGLRYES